LSRARKSSGGPVTDAGRTARRDSGVRLGHPGHRTEQGAGQRRELALIEGPARADEEGAMNRFRAEPARGIGTVRRFHQYRSGLLLY
jgi:hypothetical protein